MHSKNLLVVMSFLTLACSTGPGAQRKTERPALPPTVKRTGRRPPQPLTVGKTFKGDLKVLYTCMVKNAYTYMFLSAKSALSKWGYAGKRTGDHKIDNLGIFAAGTSGFIFYASFNNCLAKSVGKKPGSFGKLSALEAISGIKRFKGKMFKYARKINPAIIKWGVENLIPTPTDPFMGTTFKGVYHGLLFRAARLFFHIYRDLQPRLDEEARDYRTYLEQHPKGDIIDYLRPRFTQRYKKWYPLQRNGSFLTGYHVAGFWLRRRLGGSDEALYKALIKLMTLYDEDYLLKYAH